MKYLKCLNWIDSWCKNNY